ncbi:MAG: flagellar basal body-associated FliL family protein [Alphaproteobacteria bacterium]|nr:flagellar basal body-associated FliL family protein [Alphaproteobacteria bacterium]
MLGRKKKEKASEASPDQEKEEKPEPEAKAKGEEGAEGEAAAEGEGEGEGGHKKGKKKLIFIAGGAGLVILIVVGVVLSGVLGGGKGEGHTESEEEIAAKAAAAVLAAKPVYYELPQFLVNLNTTGTRVSFLKMSVTLELRDPQAVATMDANKPRVMDIFNTYLRELHAGDIQGSAGIYRLRTELLSRLNSTIEDGTVKDILFGEIIVQ